MPFFTFDILTDEAMRQGVKDFGAWPTFPQLYLKGELVGGCDIITEMQVGRVRWAMLRVKAGMGCCAALHGRGDTSCTSRGSWWEGATSSPRCRCVGVDGACQHLRIQVSRFWMRRCSGHGVNPVQPT